MPACLISYFNIAQISYRQSRVDTRSCRTQRRACRFSLFSFDWLWPNCLASFTLFGLYQVSETYWCLLSRRNCSSRIYVPVVGCCFERLAGYMRPPSSRATASRVCTLTRRKMSCQILVTNLYTPPSMASSFASPCISVRTAISASNPRLLRAPRIWLRTCIHVRAFCFRLRIRLFLRALRVFQQLSLPTRVVQ